MGILRIRFIGSLAAVICARGVNDFTDFMDFINF